MRESSNSYYAKSRYIPACSLSAQHKANASLSRYSNNESAFSTEKSSFDLLKSFDYLNSEEGKKMTISQFKAESNPKKESKKNERSFEDISKNVLSLTSTKYLDNLIRKNLGDKIFPQRNRINPDLKKYFLSIHNDTDITLPIINKKQIHGDYKFNELQYRNPLTTKLYLNDISKGILENEPD